MKRKLTKDELLAQLAEKEQRIRQHLEVMKDEGDFVTQSLKIRASDAGDRLREAANRAREVAPAVLGGGLALYLTGRMAKGLMNRRRRTAAAKKRSHDELAFLSEAIAHRIAQSGTPAHPVAVPPLDLVPREEIRMASPAAPRRTGDFWSLLLAALAGAAIQIAMEHVPWQRLVNQARERMSRQSEAMLDRPQAALPPPSAPMPVHVPESRHDTSVVTVTPASRPAQASDYDLL